MTANKPSRKKSIFPVGSELKSYLKRYQRHRPLPVTYADLIRFSDAYPLLKKDGEDTHWKTVNYRHNELQELYQGLTRIYSYLKNDGDISVMEHLTVDRIDFCSFGNTQPFRIRIINRLNDNYDHFYVKQADASRVYGLELEEILSPNKMVYFLEGKTLIEEHVAGIPGDDFIEKRLDISDFEQIRIAKEFVKFNERCFVRLLGDMRAYNYVIDITPDIEGSQYRIRPIDFDQQSYEGRKSFYLPQYFKENNPIIFLGMKHMSEKTVRQYQNEERSMIAARIVSAGSRLEELLTIMKKDRISSPEKVEQLANELGEHHHSTAFEDCKSMGDIVATNISLLLKKVFKQSITS